MIYYIYKVRRKQTSIRFSRSAPTHRYLRSISWISWNGHRPQPSTSWVFPHRAAVCAHVVFAAVPIPQGRGSCAPASASAWRTKQIFLQSLLEKKRNIYLPFPRTALTRRSSCVAPSALLCPLPLSRAAIRGRSAACPSRRLLRPSHKQKMRARSIAPRTRSKKRRLLAQENTRRHAWLSRSCFGRKNLFIDGPHSLLPFFLSPFLQRKRKKKTEANSAGSNTSLGLTSFVLTMYAIGPAPSSAEIYVAIATRFVRDCVEDLGLLAASMERISRCSWHIKDHCLGVIKASRISFYPCISFLPQIFPQKNLTFPKKSDILYTQDEERKHTHPFLPSSSNMRRQTQQTDGVAVDGDRKGAKAATGHR